MKKRGVISLILGLSLCISSMSVCAADYKLNGLSASLSTQTSTDNTVEDTASASDKQQSSIAMLNYVTVLTQEINSSSNSKIYLDMINV